MSSNIPMHRGVERLDSSRWAPWWLYVLVIVPANLGSQQALPDEAAWWLRGGLTVAVAAAGIALVSVVYRAATTRPARR
jgi:hypothetical protein